jgi:hypothetical protein
MSIRSAPPLALTKRETDHLAKLVTEGLSRRKALNYILLEREWNSFLPKPSRKFQPTRVFILGAGASRAATSELEHPMPLASEFFMRRYTDHFWHNRTPFQRSELRAVIRHYFSHKEDSPINIEEVLTFLENWNRNRPSTEDEHFVETARQQLLTYVYETVYHISFPPPKRRSHFYNALARRLNPKDSIVTFNWDILLDRALARTETGKTLLDKQSTPLSPQHARDVPRLTNQEGAVYAKLHGSVGWVVCRDPTCPGHGYPQRIGTQDRAPRLEPFELGLYVFCDQCAGPVEFAILPPHFRKSLSASNFFRRQTRLAIDVLERAEEIVVIGYSFPQFDLETLSLMRSIRLRPTERGLRANLRRLIVVDPSEKSSAFKERIRDVLGVDRSASFGSPVEVLWYASANDYLRGDYAPSCAQHRKRTVRHGSRG